MTHHPTEKAVISVNQLLNALIDKGHCARVDSARDDLLQEHYAHLDLPLYIRALVAFGALLSFVFTVLFVALLGIHEVGFIPLGLLCIFGAISLNASLEDRDQSVRAHFLFQLSLQLMLIGKGLVMVGALNEAKGEEGYALMGLCCALLLTAVTYHRFPISFDRFTSSSVVLSFAIIAVKMFTPDDLGHLSINLSLSIYLGGATLLLLTGRFHTRYQPIAYALLMIIANLTLLILVNDSASSKGRAYDIDLTHFQYVLSLWLIGLMGWITGDWSALKRSPLIWASLGALTLGYVSTPALLLTLGCIVLGYATHRRALTYVGFLSLPMVIFHYYYSLNLSLMEKSGVLFASGAVLLIGAWYLSFSGLIASPLQRIEGVEVSDTERELAIKLEGANS